MAGEDERARKRTPFSARLPQVPLNQAVPIAEALAALGAPATPHVIAQQMGTTYSSSGFKTKIAAAGYYGLIRVDGDRRTLTARGETLTSGDDERARQARREGVMSTNFGPVIYSLRGRSVSEPTIALRLQGDLNVPEASATNVAKALMASARDAGLLTEDGRLDAAAIEGAASVIPSSTTEDGSSPRPSPSKPHAAQQTRAQPTPKPDTPKKDPPRPEETRPPFVCSVQVVVNVDATSLTPQQIAELVRELQRTPQS